MSSSKVKRKSKSPSPTSNEDANTTATAEESQSTKSESKATCKKSSKKKAKKKKSNDDEACSINSGSSYYGYDSDSSLSSSGSEISLLTENVKNKQFRKDMAKEASKSSLLDSASIRNGSFRRKSLLSDEDESTNREEDELSEFEMDLTFLKSTNNSVASISSYAPPGTPTNDSAVISSGSNNSTPANLSLKKTKLGRVKSSDSEERERSSGALRDSAKMTPSKEKKEKQRKKEDINNSNNNSPIQVEEEIYDWASVVEGEGDKKRTSKKSTQKKDKSPDPCRDRDTEVDGYTKPRLRRSKSSGDSTDGSMFRSFTRRAKQLANKRNESSDKPDEEMTTPRRKSKKIKEKDAEKHDWQALAQIDKHDWQALAQSEEQKKKNKDKTKEKHKVPDSKGRKSSFDHEDQASRELLPNANGTYIYNWSPKKMTSKSPKKSKLKKSNSTDANGNALPPVPPLAREAPLVSHEASAQWGNIKVEKTSTLQLKKSIGTGGITSSPAQLLPPVDHPCSTAQRLGSATSNQLIDTKTEKTTTLKLKKSISTGSNRSSSPGQPLALVTSSQSFDALTAHSSNMKKSASNDCNGYSGSRPLRSKSESEGDEGQAVLDTYKKSSLGGAILDDSNPVTAIPLPTHEALQRSEGNTSEDTSWSCLGGSDEIEPPIPQPLTRGPLLLGDVSSISVSTRNDDFLGDNNTKSNSLDGADVKLEEALEPKKASASSNSSVPEETTSTPKMSSWNNGSPQQEDDSKRGSNGDGNEKPEKVLKPQKAAFISNSSSLLGDDASRVETSSWGDGSQYQGYEKINDKEETTYQSRVGMAKPKKFPKKKKRRGVTELALGLEESSILDKGDEEYQDVLVACANSIMKMFTDDPKQYNDEAAISLLQEFPQAAKIKYALESSSFRGGQGKTRHYLLSLLCALGASREATKMCFDLYPDAIHKFDEHIGTPLHYAISFGIKASFSREMWSDSIFDSVEFLLKQEPLLLSSQHNHQGQSALHQAILSLCPSALSMPDGKHKVENYQQLAAIADVVISLLLENNNLIATLPDAKHLLPLHLAALRAVPVEILERILKEHAPACSVKCHAKGFTPLHYAVQVFGLAASTIDENKADASCCSLQDHVANIQTLIKGHAAAAQIQDRSGDLPLHVLVSAFYGQCTMGSDRERCDSSASTFVNVARAVSLAYPKAVNTPGSSGKTPHAITKFNLLVL